jgi:dTDP-4-dehydrorhamnose reductase
LAARLGTARAVPVFRTRPVAGGLRFDAGIDPPSALFTAAGPVGPVFLLHGAVNPEACARDPAGTAAVNVTAMQALIEAAWAAGALPIFASSDYVFDGTRGKRREHEAQCPTTAYGRQKAAVEQWLAASGRPHIVARLSKVVSEDPALHSVLAQLLPDIRAGAVLRMATDQVFSPAHVEDVAAALAALPAMRVRGILHVAGPVPWSRHDLTAALLRAIARRTPVTARLERISLRDIPFLEPRPLDTSLDTARIEALRPGGFRSMEQVAEAIATAAFGPAKA